MNGKSGHVARLLEPFQNRELPANYLAYFDCFHRQLFYEAHDVLEALWLPMRKEPEGNFFKGLIQLAGAFVHVQKNRNGPAQALLRLAAKNLTRYGSRHRRLDLQTTRTLIQDWNARLNAPQGAISRLLEEFPPRLDLIVESGD